MKKASTFLVLISLAMWVQAQTTPDYDRIAENIVKNSLEVQPGEVVFLYGTPAEMDLLGAMYVAVSKAGGQPAISIGIPEAEKKAIMETPIDYLRQIPINTLMQLKIADCIFNTGSLQDPGLFADVPEERLAASRKGNNAIQEASRTAKFRAISLGQTGGIPSPAFADLHGASYQEMVEMFWNSVNTDYDQMTSTGKMLRDQLKAGSEVHITSETGTDLYLRVDHHPVKVNCGRCLENDNSFGPAMAYLPAGEVYACVDPSSARGTVVVPSVTYRGKVVKDLKLTFEEGRIRDISAEQNGELVQKSLEMGTGDKDVLSVIDIGINPESHPLENSDYYSWEMAGMITITTGINQWAGGDVVSDMGLTLHLANSSLAIDGNELIHDGKLNLSQAMLISRVR
jgi:leucyl aminopeptidase (aminopeptidase T)